MAPQNESLPVNAPREGAKCDEVVFNETEEELRKLLDDVKVNKIPKDPSEYNHEMTDLKETDTVDTILAEIFSKLDVRVPPTAVSRLTLALTQTKLDMNVIRTQYRASSWTVENGLLIFLNVDKVKLVSFPLLPWTALNNRPKLGEVLEEKQHNYGLGVYTGMDADKRPSVEDLPTVLEGSADATKHTETVRKTEWYQEKTQAAELMLKILDSNPARYDTPTILLIHKRETLLRELASQTEFQPNKFILKYEKGKNPDDIFGRDGVYNIVLAFQRIIDSGQDLERSEAMIVLKIGTNERKEEERYSKWQRNKVEVPDEPPVVVCPPEPEPPKPPEPEPPKPPEPEPPKPPEDKENEPYDPDELKEDLKKVENATHKISDTAEMQSKTSVTGLTSKMTAAPFEYGGATYEMLYVIDKANPKNPARYIAFDKSDPYTILIGEMKYDFGALISNAEPGNVLKTVTLDKSSRTAMRSSMLNILNNL